MEYERPVKILIILSGLFVLTSTTIHLWSWHSVNEINSMSRDLNDAERPEKAYSNLMDDVVDANTTEKEKARIQKKLEGETLASRLRFSGKMMLDVAIAGGYFFDAVQGNNSKISKEARYYVRCTKAPYYQKSCENEKNLPIATTMAAGWMELGTNIGGLKAFWNNETAVKKFNNYIERAEYYDQRLRKGGYETRPVEMAYYTNRGLFMVGNFEGNLTVGNDTVNPERKGKLMYADLELEPGVYRVKASSQAFDLKVVHEVPDLATNEGKFMIEVEEGRYSDAVLNGSKGTEVLQLEANRTMETPEIPSETYVEEGIFENSTRYRPYTVKLISPEVNVTLMEGKPEDKGIDQYYLYAYGMSEKEYRKTQEIFDKIRKYLWTSGNQKSVPESLTATP
jgi:hypothetical protein